MKKIKPIDYIKYMPSQKKEFTTLNDYMPTDENYVFFL